MKGWMKGSGQIALAVGLVLAGLLTFPAQAAELGKLRVGIIPVGDCLQIFVADAKGYFKDEGLTVEMPRLAGGAAIAPAVEGGTLELGLSCNPMQGTSLQSNGQWRHE